jgi:hypothetical protein
MTNSKLDPDGGGVYCIYSIYTNIFSGQWEKLKYSLDIGWLQNYSYLAKNGIVLMENVLVEIHKSNLAKCRQWQFLNLGEGHIAFKVESFFSFPICLKLLKIICWRWSCTVWGNILLFSQKLPGTGGSSILSSWFRTQEPMLLSE